MSATLPASTPTPGARQRTARFRTDDQFTIVEWGPDIEQMTGWTDVEAIGRSAIEVLRRTDGDVPGRSRDRRELRADGSWHGLVTYLDRDDIEFSAWLEAERDHAGGYVVTLLVPEEFRKMDRNRAVEDDRHHVRQLFEERLRAARGDTTQAELARKVGVRPNEINRWEHASTWGVLPSAFYRRRLQRALEVDDPLYLWPETEVDR